MCQRSSSPATPRLSSCLIKSVLRLKQVTGIDIQDEVWCRLVTLHMQHDMQRHQRILHACEQAGHVLRGQKAKEAAGGVAPMQIGAVKGNSNGKVMQAEKQRDDAKKLAEKNKDKHCFYLQKTPA